VHGYITWEYLPREEAKLVCLVFRKMISFPEMGFPDPHSQMGGKAKLGYMQLASQEEVSLVHQWMPLEWQMTLARTGMKKQSTARSILSLFPGIGAANHIANQLFFKFLAANQGVLFLVFQFYRWQLTDGNSDQVVYK